MITQTDHANVELMRYSLEASGKAAAAIAIYCCCTE